VGAVLAACSNGSGGADAGAGKDGPTGPVADAALGPDASTAVEDLTTTIADSVCDALFRCCDDDLVEYFAPYRANEKLAAFKSKLPPEATLTAATCKPLMKDMIEIMPFGDWVAQVKAGRVGYDPTKTASCVAELSAAKCGSEMRAAIYDSTCFAFAAGAGGAEQRRMFTRTGKTGDACAPVRDGVGAGFYGTCDAKTDFCCFTDPMSPGSGCAYPFNKDGSARAGTCAPVAKTGQSCGVTLPLQLCATGSDCDFDTEKCVEPSTAPISVGSMCSDASYHQLGECQTSWCDAGGSNKCEPFKENGAACIYGFECATGRCQAMKCADNNLCGSDSQMPMPDGGLPMADGGLPMADAALPIADAALPDAAAPADAMGLPKAGETCTDAPDLALASTKNPPGSLYGYTVASPYGTSNDYATGKSQALPPKCSVVYDSPGNEVVYAVTLKPNDKLSVRYAVTPSQVPYSMYLLDACPSATWPDYDQSGSCGNNELNATSYCGAVGCAFTEWSYRYPTSVGGQNTVTKTFYLVLDTVGATPAQSFVLDWRIE
jgi:hypothetical protein